MFVALMEQMMSDRKDNDKNMELKKVMTSKIPS